ncbi:MAG: hypothetical protein COV09_01450 [Candidatus Vogelbacteria bacterium CG10_big_fil_rev_8_21_14_0_10_50_13]|uniref:Uncharacterized protein n=1 Tax=Candidatus Vogelbacteria bacterium CG10_big_fil_rev_8_21_14_0_10_50_13 TaxID=1975044 RepID=A0A2H0RG53_9BACT|nr:MAG: hypothetical protein COV09_01450 [Candidatus Vogelbacteria bacterium CG10_big_fil_rev_8_21_14_0_10_50_13]
MNKFLILTILAASWLGLAAMSRAQSLPSAGQKLIGGQIEQVELCCNGLKIEVGDPNSGEFLFMPGKSTLYPYYNIFTPGAWVLGTASGQGVCQKLFSFPPCVKSDKVDGIIDIIGTSSL